MEQGYVLNQYVFVEKLGEGGMGQVWRGRHTQLDYEVAIKFLNPQFAHDADLQERFLNEGKRQANLHHPHIVRAIDFISEAGHHYLVMQFVAGMGLDARIEESRGPLAVEESIDISRQVLSALGYAHRKGVIHRDVKPSNILMDENGQCYLTDFGVALAAGQQRMTRTGTVLGTAYYMSPEQIRRPHTVDHRTDIYAFGVVLYEMLTGVPPFDAEDGNEFLVKQAHVEQVPRRPSSLNPAISKPLESVVLCALAKEPGDRFQDCEEMIQTLELAAAGKPPLRHRSRPRVPTPYPVSTSPERETPGMVQRTWASRLSKVQWLALAACIIFALVFVAWYSKRPPRLALSGEHEPIAGVVKPPSGSTPMPAPTQTAPANVAPPAGGSLPPLLARRKEDELPPSSAVGVVGGVPGASPVERLAVLSAASLVPSPPRLLLLLPRRKPPSRLRPSASSSAVTSSRQCW